MVFYVLILGKYVGNRPIKLRKSKWQERTDFEALEKQKVAFFFFGFWFCFGMCLACTYKLCLLPFSCLAIWQNQTHKKPKLPRKSVLHK